MNKIKYVTIFAILLISSPAFASNKIYDEDFDDQAVNNLSASGVTATATASYYTTSFQNSSESQYEYATGRGGSGYCLSDKAGNPIENVLYIRGFSGSWPTDEIYASYWVRFSEYTPDADPANNENIKTLYMRWNGSSQYVHVSIYTSPSSLYYSAATTTSGTVRNLITSGYCDSGTCSTYPSMRGVNLADGNWHHIEVWIKFTTANVKLWVDKETHPLAVVDDDYDDALTHWDGSSQSWWTFPSFDAEEDNTFGRQIDDVEVWDGMPEEEPDTTASVISGGLPSTEQVCTTNPRDVTLSASTNENATLKYGLSGEDDLDTPAAPVDADTTYDLLPHTMSSTGEISHSQVVSSACGASYTYYLRSMDAAENKNTSSTAISYSVEAAAEEDMVIPTVTISYPADDPHTDTTQYITVEGTASANGVKTITSIVATSPTIQNIGAVTGTTSWSVPVTVSQGTLSADLLYGAGAFASTGSWSVGTDWTIADGKASHTGVATNCWLSHAFASEIGKTYRVSYPVGAGATGSLWLSQYGFGGVSQPLVITEGAHTIDVVATRANSTLAFGASPFVGDLDNVTVKKLQYDTLTITATDNLGYVGTKTVQLGYIAPELTSPRKVVGLGAKVELDLGGGRQLKF